ncbi:hypothetical protein E3T28_14830 [Cryobacterium sinapicolor]|uniref:HK97 gp10 family phage protein n=1 Tax=Cryobacterium sinapicolor TaxID=1259236 RepID=A0ABY2IWJ9_9MICO|nr:hypothetical protein [Cryobacterium sinapicolor]TFC94574.1 hypothetical protein E3T28_14830 [Cryobacterium sinapicolor]
MIRLDVYNSRELQATILSIRRAPKEIQAQIRKHTKAMAAPEYRKAMAESAETRLEHRVLVQTGTVAVSNQNIKLSSGASTRALSGGLKPSENAAAIEFGTKRDLVRTYDRRSRKGGTHKVTRHTRQQLRPLNRKGYVFYPAVTSLIPRIASLWVQTTVRTFHEALEGK